VFVENVRDQRRHLHVTGVQRQVDRLAGFALSIKTALGPYRMRANSY